MASTSRRRAHLPATLRLRGSQRVQTKQLHVLSGLTYAGERTEGAFKAFSISDLTRFYEVFAVVSQRQGWKADWESQRYLMEEIFRGKRHMAS